MTLRVIASRITIPSIKTLSMTTSRIAMTSIETLSIKTLSLSKKISQYVILS